MSLDTHRTFGTPEPSVASVQAGSLTNYGVIRVLHKFI